MSAGYEGKSGQARKAVVDALNDLLTVSHGDHGRRIDDEMNMMLADVSTIKANAVVLVGERNHDELDVLEYICDESMRSMADVRTRRTGMNIPAVIRSNPDAAAIHEFLCSDLLVSLDSATVGGLDAFIPYSRKANGEDAGSALKPVYTRNDDPPAPPVHGDGKAGA